MTSRAEELEEIELDLFTDGIWRRFGIDFRNYARASLRRRVSAIVEAERAGSVTELLARVLHDQASLERLLLGISSHVTTMFRDPSFFVTFRNELLPLMRTHPFIRIWCAGCATGEDVYSIAVLLTEAGLYERSRIYATDMSALVVEKAKAGIFPSERIKEFEENYHQAGGEAPFSTWFTSSNEHMIFEARLRKNVVFAVHHLAVDRSFNAFNVILCRNVLIDFNPTLRNTVHKLLHESLQRFGYLILGRGETLTGTSVEKVYDPIALEGSIFRRRESLE